MNMRTIFLLACILFNLPASGQHAHSPEHYVPPSSEFNGPQYSRKLFRFTNGRSLAISFFPDTDTVGNNGMISEFVLYEYGQDTSLAFFSAVERCKLSFVKDTLFIERIEPLAIGVGNNFVDTTWLTEKWFYNNDGKPAKSEALSSHFNCDQAKIDAVLSDYLSTRWKTQIETYSDKEQEAMMNLAARLMLISACSGGKYEPYFKDFKKRFQPDGGNEDWYNIMANIVETARRLK